MDGDGRAGGVGIRVSSPTKVSVVGAFRAGMSSDVRCQGTLNSISLALVPDWL